MARDLSLFEEVFPELLLLLQPRDSLRPCARHGHRARAVLGPSPDAGPDLGVQPDDIEAPGVEPEQKQEVLENRDVVVQRVHVDGLGRTKEDLLTYEIKEVFRATNLIDVMKKSHQARQKLLRLGVFRRVNVVIDTSRGEGALPNGLEVTFHVTELRRLTGSYNTTVGNNEGSMVLGLKLPNLLGRAERLSFQFSFGTKETAYGVSFFKPQPGNFERSLTLNAYKVTGQFPWSSLRETDRGASAELTFPLWRTIQSLKYEAVWRELSCLSRAASFAVREETGHSLKSSLSHSMILDSRNSTILPRSGGLLRVHQELAGYTGGDASFLKEDFELQLNKSLFWTRFVFVSGPVHVSVGRFTSAHRRRQHQHRRQVLSGGPTSVRGFSMYSMGPQSEGDYLGGEAYWAGGVHLFTPLPFTRRKGGFMDLFRTHFFLNAGNLCNLNYAVSVWSQEGETAPALTCSGWSSASAGRTVWDSCCVWGTSHGSNSTTAFPKASRAETGERGWVGQSESREETGERGWVGQSESREETGERGWVGQSESREETGERGWVGQSESRAETGERGWVGQSESRAETGERGWVGQSESRAETGERGWVGQSESREETGERDGWANQSPGRRQVQSGRASQIRGSVTGSSSEPGSGSSDAFILKET
ncbi:hypothetical protein WMY93_032679 [Mugilogobius chulae]|uniref:POTRA domain-containing protein n=1 Tax=Mugilogobius chulae TaxID=88201 RepID=A0AAW0MVN9_9GOBI